MRNFLDEDFLLKTPVAKHLFHDVARDMPIIDYHCHLSAKEIWENRPAENLTELWLGGDHYKWRVMRAAAEPEELITGKAGDREKFNAFARALPLAIGNPVYHWTHLELQRYFGITKPLGPDTADEIWEEANRVLSDQKHTPQFFIEQSNVFALCTTEDPVDSLKYHDRIWAEGRLKTRILPAIRPDLALAIEKADWAQYIRRLEKVSGVAISRYEDMLKALSVCMDAFAERGCIASDHGFEYMPYVEMSDEELSAVFDAAMAGKALNRDEADGYKTRLLLWLAEEYHRRGWAMELHIGSIRSVNTKGVASIGEATGFDTIGDAPVALPLARFMDDLEKRNCLPKMILFCLNDKDNMVLSAMAGTFQDSSVASKIQFGTAWWFQDHRDGMEKQMRCLADTGVFGCFIGMLTDSRSFLSYPRHEYFRRILCNLIGELVENGEYPNDDAMLSRIVRGICFENAKAYFGL